jgi:hypothetical protein
LCCTVLQECKIAGSVGFTQTKLYGANAYTIPLTTLSVGYQP